MAPKRAGFCADLAVALEQDHGVRELVRSRGSLIGWPKKENVGLPSLLALSMNSRILVILARVYCARPPKVKAPPIQWLRSEYTKFMDLMSMVQDQVKGHLDVWGMKKLFSLGLRRWGVAMGARKVAGL